VRTNDGFVMVGAFSPRHALALADLIDRPDIAHDPRFAGPGMRAHLDDLHHAVEGWTATRSSDEAESAIRAAGVPCSRYRAVDEVLGDEALHARGTLRQARDAVGEFTIVGSPIRFADEEGLQSPPPDTFEVHDLGTHTRDVLARLAGYDRQRIDDLIERGTGVSSEDEARAAATTSKQPKELP
jgi:crotonobetainyl-CoA:carnitine CoA-transferase CaiB-like acyl-CoA transferase